MNLSFNEVVSDKYKNASQIIRLLTESWVEKEIFCPNCGSILTAHKKNNPAADFYCSVCNEDYELKSKKNNFGKKIVDGAYDTIIDKLNSFTNPNFFLLAYKDNKVSDFLMIPKHFLIPRYIEKRKPLSINARRSGWIGCNILFNNIPDCGKIYYIKEGVIEKKKKVLDKWSKTLFLRNTSKQDLKGWIFDVMNCIEKLEKSKFTIDEIYAFENVLQKKYPDNHHIKDKLRQQLQYLRDKGYLNFMGKGIYSLR